MQKTTTLFKSVIQGVETYFHFENTCSTEIAKIALLDCLKWIGQIEDNNKAQEQAKADAATQKPLEVQPETPKAE